MKNESSEKKERERASSLQFNFGGQVKEIHTMEWDYDDYDDNDGEKQNRIAPKTSFNQHRNGLHFRYTNCPNE